MTGRAGLLAGVLAVAGALLGGCGGGTRTVSVSSVPAASSPADAHTASAPATTPAATATTRTAPPAGTSTQGGASTSTTRTAPAPAFVHTTASTPEAATTEANAAAAAVTARGYTPVDLSTYHPTQTLRVLVGTRDGSTAGYNQRAFFFLDGRYLGTDASQPSASVRVLAQSDTEVALAYALYRPHDAECCPSGGQAVVHFQLDNGVLTPLQPLPSASSTAPLSRQ